MSNDPTWPAMANPFEEDDAQAAVRPIRSQPARRDEETAAHPSYLAGDPDDIEEAALKTGVELARSGAESIRLAIRWLALVDRPAAEKHARARTAATELANDLENRLAERRR